MADSGRQIEESFNLALGEALRETTARWRGRADVVLVERGRLLSGSASGKRPDILVLDPEFPPVVVETSFDAADADKDAIARLGVGVRRGNRQIRTAVAVHIPERYRRLDRESSFEDLKNGARIRYALHQARPKDIAPSSRRWPSVGFLQGGVSDLAALLSAAAMPKEEIERVAATVAEFVDGAADGLDSVLPDGTKRQIAGRIHQRSFLKGLRTTMVLWLNALLTQQRLHAQGVPYSPSLDFSSAMPPMPSRQIEIWRAIQGQNWRAIFDPAVEVLEMAANSAPRAASEALATLTRAVEEIETAPLGMHINVGAELFPKLSEDRKEAAAFYTQPATAELLAGLTLRRGDLPDDEWADGTLFERRFLADLACGTGTLLRAGYRRILSLHERAGGSVESAAQLHRGAMETGLVGTDISPIAAHLTSSSLAAIGAGEPYGDTRIGWVSVGGTRSSTGALEYLKGDRVNDLFQAMAGRASGSRGQQHARAVEVRERRIDWIMMNPPYSRTRGGQSAFDVAGLSDKEKSACQKRWGILLKGEPAIKTAGMAASFLAMARKKVRNGGRIGFVLPLTAAFAESWAVTRRMVEQQFDDIVAVAVAAGQALGPDALSADTGMEEMLLVGTCAPGLPTARPKTIRLVTLYQPVNRVGDAGEIARAIEETLAGAVQAWTDHPIMAGEEEIGTVHAVEVTREGDPWACLGALHAGMAFAALALAAGRLEFDGLSEGFGVGMTTIADLFQVGPTHDRIGHPFDGDGRGAFRFYPVTGADDTIGPDRALWSANSKTQQRLVILPTHRGTAPAGVGSDAERQAMRGWRSTLHYARNMRWTSQTLLAGTTGRAIMGGRAWTALLHDNPYLRKAFALWANSTPGMMVHWTRGQRQQTGRAPTQVKALHRIPCPRLDHLPEETLRWAAARFDELATSEIRAACQAHADPTRIAIDKTVREMLGLSDAAASVMAALRRLWCAEPSVHGLNDEALALLRRETM